MEKIMRYVILPEERLILEFLKGNVTWPEYSQMKEKQIVDPKYLGTYNVVIDIQELHTDFTLAMEKEISDYVEYLNKQETKILHRTAAITETPKQLLHAEFFKLHGGKLDVLTKAFTTYTSAFSYVGIPEHKQQKVMQLLEELKK